MKKIILLFSFIAVFAFANEHEAKHEKHMGACKADQEKFCKDVKPGEGRIIKCMKEHEASLSAECKNNISKLEEHMPCFEDHQKFCKGMKPGDGKFGPCMKEHEAELSPKCKEHLKEMKEHHEKMGDKMRKMRKKNQNGEKPNDE